MNFLKGKKLGLSFSCEWDQTSGLGWFSKLLACNYIMEGGDFKKNLNELQLYGQGAHAVDVPVHARVLLSTAFTCMFQKVDINIYNYSHAKMKNKRWGYEL